MIDPVKQSAIIHISYHSCFLSAFLLNFSFFSWSSQLLFLFGCGLIFAFFLLVWAVVRNLVSLQFDQTVKIIHRLTMQTNGTELYSGWQDLGIQLKVRQNSFTSLLRKNQIAKTN